MVLEEAAEATAPTGVTAAASIVAVGREPGKHASAKGAAPLLSERERIAKKTLPRFGASQHKVTPAGADIEMVRARPAQFVARTAA